MLLVSLIVSSLDSAEKNNSYEAMVKALADLDWKTSGTYKLPYSSATIRLPIDRVIALGKEANQAQVIFGEEPSPTLEAITVQNPFRNVVSFDWHGDGYVSVDDWNQVNAKQLFQSIRSAIEKKNAERKQHGLQELHAVSLLQAPIFDRPTKTIYYAVELDEGGRSVVNSIALKLGRYGYEKLIWATDKSTYKQNDELDILINAFQFDPGYRYEDFSTGDKVADFGISSLITTTVGGDTTTGLIKKILGIILFSLSIFLYRTRRYKQPQVSR